MAEDNKVNLDRNIMTMRLSANLFRERALNKGGWMYFTTLLGGGSVDIMISNDDTKTRFICGIVGFTSLLGALRLGNGVIRDMERYSSRMEVVAVDEYRADQIKQEPAEVAEQTNNTDSTTETK